MTDPTPTPAPLDLEAIEAFWTPAPRNPTVEGITAVADVRDLIDECRRLRAERDDLRAALVRAGEDYDEAAAERDRLAAERDAAIREAQRFSADADELEAERDRLAGDLAACRAVLAPLLAAGGNAEYAEGACQFCACWVEEHAPDCPVLRAAALLGTEAGRGG